MNNQPKTQSTAATIPEWVSDHAKLGSEEGAAENLAAWLAETGAQPSTAHPPCAHSLTHQAHPDDDWEMNSWHSACKPPDLDHHSMWNMPDGSRAIVHHPYDERPAPDAVSAFDQRWGTSTLIHPPETSWYYPGRTTMVVVTLQKP